MIRFDRGREDAVQADPVGAHDRHPALAIRGGEFGLHRAAVARAQTEDVAQLDPAVNLDPALAVVGAGVALARQANVLDLIGAPVAPVVDVAQMNIGLVAARDQIGRIGDRDVGHDARSGPLRLQIHRRGGSRHPTQRRDLLLRHRPNLARSHRVLQLELVHIQVAADDREDRRLVRHEERRLRCRRLRHVQEPGQIRDRGDAGRLDHFTLERRLRRRHAARELGALLVRRVATARAEADGVFADRGEEHELLRLLATDRARVGLHRDDGDPAALEDGGVGLGHGVVRALECLVVRVEGVGVLHRELAHPDQAAARAGLVAELGLNLVHPLWELSIRLHGFAEQVGGRLLMRRGKHVLPLPTVQQPEEDGAVGLIPARLLPQLQRLDGGHMQLLRPGPLHLFADDLLDLAEAAPSQRHVGVDAGCELGDQPCPQRELMVDGLGLRGGLPQSAPKKRAHPLRHHGLLSSLGRRGAPAEAGIPSSRSRGGLNLSKAIVVR